MSNPVATMDEYEPETLTYQQTIPAKIATLQMPTLGLQANTSLRRATRAMKELAEATAISQLRIDPLLAGSLIRLEAVSSSQIEDIDADFEQVLIHQEGPDDSATMSRPEITELELVAQNIAAAASAITATERVTQVWLKGLHKRLMTGSDLIPAHVGEWRDCPVWIGTNRATARFEGPDADLVPALLSDLTAFCDRFDLNPVAQAAIAHAQFEAIHPFVDGNGRIGRALVHPILRRAAPSTIVPTAHALYAAKGSYFDGLASYQAGDIDGWIVTFADAVERAALAALYVTRGLDNLVSGWDSLIRTHGDRTTDTILKSLISNPVVTVASAQQQSGVSRPAAFNSIKRLVDAGVLRRTVVPTSGRAHVWVAGGVLDVLASIDQNLGPRR